MAYTGHKKDAENRTQKQKKGKIYENSHRWQMQYSGAM